MVVDRGVAVTFPVYFSLMTYGGWEWHFIGTHCSLYSYQKHYSANSYVAVQ
jgi:hypothetical protein